MAKETRFDFAKHYPADQIEMINGFPAPPTPKIRPLAALVGVTKLIGNKEDTRQVFDIVYALAGRSYKRVFEQFSGTPHGRRVVTGETSTVERLCDKEWLRSLPEGSVGRAYLKFMESENLTPDGITSAAEEAGVDYNCETQFEEYRRGMLHFEVVHDVWHVLTGYGRDTLGELSVLGVTYAQNGNNGLRLIIEVGSLAAKLEQPRYAIRRAVREGIERGRQAKSLILEDIETLMPEQLTDARARLNLTSPTAYNSIPQEIRDGLLKPRVKGTQAEREEKRLKEAGQAAV